MLDPILGEVSDFLYHECELLDSGQFSAWLDLFTPDAVYWVPLAQGQADPDSDFSLMYEDVLLLRMRIERMQHPAAHGMEPPPRTSRVIGNIRVRDGEKGQLEATARFTLFEAEDGRHRIFAGRYQFLLERREQFRISRKRVDLVNSDAPFEVDPGHLLKVSFATKAPRVMPKHCGAVRELCAAGFNIMSEFVLKRKPHINCLLRGQIASTVKRFIVTNEPRMYLQCCVWRVRWRATAACLNSVSRTLSALSVGLVLAAALSAMAGGEDYPSRVITLIAPSGPGSTPDVLARILAHKLSEQLGKQVVVLNRVGAGTDIGTASVAHSEPDGYTLLLGSIANTLNPHIKTSVGYKLNDLAPISSVAATADVLVVHPSTNISTVQELIAILKSNPGTPAGHGGIGTGPHLSLELFRRMSGVEITPVPFKGGGEALQGALAGQVFFIFNTSVSVLPLVHGGQLRALAVSSAKRISASPEIPTLAESGLPGFDVVAWFGLFAPAQTPKPIINRLSEEARKALAVPDTRKFLAGVGAEPLGSTPEAFSAYVKEEFERWGKLSKELDIHIE